MRVGARIVVTAVVCAAAFATQAQADTDIPDRALIEKVRYYYQINKHRANRGYGCNWFRVLIAFGDKTAGEWPGYGSCTLTPYTATEAQTSEKIWWGWRPVRQALEQLETAQSVEVVHVAPFRSGAALELQPQTLAQQAQLPVIGFSQATACEGDTTRTYGVATEQTDSVLWCSVQSSTAITNLAVNYEILEDSGSNYIALDDGAAEKGQTLSFTYGWDRVTQKPLPAATTYQIEIPIIDDFVTEPDGRVDIRLLPGDGYTLDSIIQTSVTLQDADDYTTDISAYFSVSYKEATSQGEFGNHSVLTPGDLVAIKLHASLPLSTKSIPLILKLISHYGEFVATNNNGLTKVSGANAYELEVTVPPLATEVVVTIATKADENFDFDNVYGYISVQPRLRDHDRIFHGLQINLQPIKSKRAPPSNFDGDLSEYTARQCVEKNIPSGQRCGIGNQQVMIEYAHDPDVLHTEEDIAFFVYPSQIRTPSVQVKATWTGFNNGDKTFTIPKSGSRITLPVDLEDQFNGDLNVKFETINSTYSIPDAYRQFTVQVEDHDPTEWEWTENTLGIPDEGSHPKIAKISLNTGTSKNLKWPQDAVTEIDFNIQGCALSVDPVFRTASVSGDLPCHIHLGGTGDTVSRVGSELDKFRIVGQLKGGITLTFEVGNDDDMDDEEITINPIIVLHNNGGIVRNIANSQGKLHPTSFIAYDDDVARNATSEPTYVGFTRTSYFVSEINNPAQPVLKAYQYDQDVLKACEQTNSLEACLKDSTVGATRTSNYTFIDTVEIPVVVTLDGTAVREDLQSSYDTHGIIIQAGGTGKMDIFVKHDNIEEFTETFTISLGSPLPQGVFPGEITSSTMNILDADPTVAEAHQRQQAEDARLAGIELEQRCADDPTLAECTPTVKVKTLTKELTDDGLTSGYTAAIGVQLTSTRNITNHAMAFQLENQKGDRANETHTTQLSGITLTAGVPKEYTFNAAFKQDSAKNGSVDYPDGQVLVKFQPQSSLNLEQPERDNLIWLRDGASDSSAIFTVRKYTSGVYADNTDGNLFVFGTSDRDLMSWETVEIPIIVEGRNGATVTTDDYRIEAVSGQNNLRVRKRNDGTYTAILTGTHTDPTTASTNNFSCGTLLVNTSRNVCLRYVNQRKGVNGLDHDYDIAIRLEPAIHGRYGQTKNTTYTVHKTTSHQVRTTVSPGNPPAGVARTIKIVPVDSTTITEPALDPVPSKSLMQRNWTDHAFDVVIDPSPASPVHFDFCLDPNKPSTASYYFDLRIVDEMDSRHNIAVGGLAWDRKSNCTKGHVTRNTKTRYYLRVHGDSHDEGTETFGIRVRVNEPNTDNVSSNGAVTKWTITNDGPIPAAWLARFGRTVAQQALDGIAGRLAAPRTPGTQGTIAGRALNLGARDRVGHENPFGGEEPGSPDWPGRAFGFDGDSARVGPGGMTTGASGGGPPAPALTLRDVLRGSSFTATGQPDATGGSVALWGRAAQATFDGREGATSLDGEVTTGLLGVDYARDRWLVGVSLLQSTGTGDYANIGARPQPCPADGNLSAERQTGPCKGMVETTLTAAVPYASLQASEQLSLWGAAGYGRGTVRLETGMGETLRTDVDWSMATLGLRGTVLAPTPEGNGPALAVTSDALWAGTDSEKTRGLESSDSDVTRLRLGLEGSWQMALDDLGQLKPTLAVGARHDGGDAETGFGVELGGGLAWAVPTVGLALNVEGRTLLTHREDDFQDQGVAASFTFDPDPTTPLGPSLTLRQDWGGQATGGLDALFAPNPLAQRQGTTATRRWGTEAAWGFPVFDGAFTGSPHVGLGLATGMRDYRLGWRLVPATPASALSVGLQATRRERDAGRPEHTVGLEITTRW